MIFGLHPLFGFLPLLLYIVLMLLGKDMNVSVLLCVILGAVLTGESITGFANTIYASLGSFCALIGFIIVLGSGLAEVLSRTRVAHNLVYTVVNKFKLRSKKAAILISMFTSTLLVALLGTLAGSNAIIAPILIPIVASVGLTPSTLGVILHGAGATGLYVGPFVPPVVTITGLTGLSYGSYLINAGIPLALIVWASTFFMACRTQKKTEGREAYDETENEAAAFVPDEKCRRATLAFLAVMAVMVVYGLAVKAGASYAILVMMTASIVVGLAGGLSFKDSLGAMIAGGSKMFWMFFMFILFEPFLNYVSASGAFEAVCGLMQPLIDVGGEVVFLMLSAAVGVFGISGTGVAQAQITHELFLPMVKALNVDMSIWGMVVLVACQVTFFVTPTVDMVGQMGLARSKNIKAMLANGWVITIITFIYVLIRAVLYTMG
ncbi:MAG: TRAP transporter large permease subunit [Lawsonibacter sp.]|nr:TRAP transporter large permease subunit [Lawsonibacter sp.]